MIWAPKSLPSFPDRILTCPSVLEIAFALEFAKNGKLPFLYSIPKYHPVITFFFKFFFSISDNSNFWVSIDNRRNCIIIDVSWFSFDMFNNHDSLFFSFMGEHSPSHNIANTIDIGNICL